MNINEKKFSALVQGLSKELYRFAYGLSRSPHQAEDLVQETFLRAWKSIHQIKDKDAASAWIYTILRREHARLYQRKRPDIRPPEELPEVPVRGYDTSTEAMVLRRAMNKLSHEYRTPLLLQVIGGYQCNDIAKIMEISPNAVMTRLYRARKMLKNKLQPDHQDNRHELPRI
jgi:RNA polymerase sigma-70 factor (ECF subfamily)